MKLFEMYDQVNDEEILNEFWNIVEEELISENTDELNTLLHEANGVIFDKFGIDPNEKKYFIAGSARLYLYPQLRAAFNLTSVIGDLDIIIPNKEDWDRAGLEKEWHEGGIYRPENSIIEAFNIWKPGVPCRDTNTILRDSIKEGGYYYMRIRDIVEYKLQLNRGKEMDIIQIIKKARSSKHNRREFISKVMRTLGAQTGREFLNDMGLAN